MCEEKLDSCSEGVLGATSNLRTPKRCELLIASYSEQSSRILTAFQDPETIRQSG